MPPVPAFEAVYKDGSKEPDIAVLGITDKMEDSTVDFEELTSLEWKSSEYWKGAEDLHLMDEIIIFGYPSFNLKLDHVTITITSETLSGFINPGSDNSYHRAWIKTNAQIAFGNREELLITPKVN